MEEAAQALRLSLHILVATSERDFDAVFQAVVRQEDGAHVLAPRVSSTCACRGHELADGSGALAVITHLRADE